MTVNSLTTGTGTIQFDQSGGGAVTYSTATTTDGSIVLTKAGADLTVGTAVNAGGAGNDVTLTTTGGGDVTLTGTTTGADLVPVTSAAKINGAGHSDGVDGGSERGDGIGDTTPLNLAATTITADTTNGNIDMNNARGGDDGELAHHGHGHDPV